jgi:hypothetical protein
MLAVGHVPPSAKFSLGLIFFSFQVIVEVVSGSSYHNNHVGKILDAGQEENHGKDHQDSKPEGFIGPVKIFHLVHFFIGLDLVH